MPDNSHAARYSFDDRLDAFKASVHKLVEKATSKPNWFGRAIEKTEETVKAHPIAAVGAALGFGYIVYRIARR